MQSNDILINNQFASKAHPEAGEGQTPSKFLTEYIARADATEPLPLTGDAYQTLGRNNTPTQLIQKPLDVSVALKRSQGLSWRTFGNDGLSYSDRHLRSVSRAVQKLYEQGHSVDKMVISFSTPYLKRMNVMDKSFTMKERGSAFGHCDQIKLRSSINRGFLFMTDAGHFRNPLWVGGFQFNTGCVHCHALLVDNCPLRDSERLVRTKYQNSPERAYHLEDRGKLLMTDRRNFIQATNNSLEWERPLVIIDEEPEALHHNFISRVSRAVNRQVGSSNQLQQLIASLPQNKKEWHYPNYHAIMQYPNHLVKAYVRSLIINSSDAIGYNRVADNLNKSAYLYSNRQHPSAELRKNGYRALDQQMNNAVYQTLRHISSHQLVVSNPLVKNGAYSIDEARLLIYRANHGHQVEDLGNLMANYRNRSFQLRYQEHYRLEQHYNRELWRFDNQSVHGRVNPVARKMRPYYLVERNYHAQSMEKYRYLLHLSRPFCSSSELLQMQQMRSRVDHNWQRQVSDTLAFPKLEQLQNDTNLRPALQIPLPDKQTFGQHLLQIEREPERPLEPRVKHDLSEIIQLYPKYQPVAREIDINHQRAIKPRLAYWHQLARFCNQSFQMGLLNSSQLLDVQRTSLEVAQPPRLMVKHNPDKANFEQVKGVDLDDCVYDLSPHESRHISHDTEHEFDDSSRKRLVAMRKAWSYLVYSNQELQQASRIFNWMRYLKRARRAILLRHRLPLGLGYQMSDRYRERNLVSVDLGTSNQYVQQDVRQLNHVSARFNRNLNRHPKQVLYQAPEPEINS